MKPWTPSTHHRVPQPAGSQGAEWYRRAHPDAEDLLYALVHTKGERDRAVSALRELLDWCDDGLRTGQQHDAIENRVRDLLRELGE